MQLRHCLWIGALAALTSLNALAQNITFSQADRTIPYNVNIAHAADLNNDQAPDFVFDLTASRNLYELLSDGHGDFAAQTISTTYCPSAVLGFGDFRRVAKEDLFVGDTTSGTTCSSVGAYTGPATYANSGTGTFTFGQKANGAVVAAVIADFNGDGKLDAVTLNTIDATHSAPAINLYYGNGTGGFSGPYLITKPASSIDTPETGYQYQYGANLLTGDFDGDGCADVAWLEYQTNPNSPNGQPPTSTLRTAYGNCHGYFSVQTVYTSSLIAPNDITAADVNHDGVTDIVSNFQDYTSYVQGGPPSPGGIAIFYGQKSRTVTFKKAALDSNAGLVKVGDFNGDGYADLAYISSDGQFPYGQDSDELRILAGDATQSFSKVSIYSLPHLSARSLLAGDFNHDGKEDLALLYSSYPEHQDNLFSILINTTATASTCSAPSAAGVNVCKPANGTTVSSPVEVQAAATIAGTLARMEIWVDGVKKYTETTSKSFDTSVVLASGKHRFDIYAVNTAGTKYETTVYATVN